MTLNNSELTHFDRVSREKPSALDLNQEFEKLAFLIAQAWKDHEQEQQPDRHSDLQADCEACVLYVTTEMGIATRAVGGPAGLEILTGGGSRAAQLACKRVVTAAQDHA